MLKNKMNVLKDHKKNTQKVFLNRIGRLSYFHDEHYEKRRNEIRHLQVETTDLPVKNLAPSLEGFSIVQLTDMHLRPFTQVEMIERAVEKSNALNPDLVVLTGDYVWHDADDIHDLVPALSKLNPRYGTYAVLGNHDYESDPKIIREAFHAHGIRVFTNEGLSLKVDNELLYLAGIDDGWLGAPDIEKTMSDHPGGDVPTVLLAHEPDMIDWYAHDTRISLQLSGHTHGGQVNPKAGMTLVKPFLGKKYVQGLYRVNESWVYTSRGIGSTGLPVRHNCPPEVTHIRLKCANGVCDVDK
jgi:predicted MPP superfamily phosphohydrolase